MSDKVLKILNLGKIDRWQYDTYKLFTYSPEAHEYLMNSLDSIIMEEAAAQTESNFAWQDGRRSVWRDIMRAINFVKQMEIEYDRECSIDNTRYEE